MNASDRRNAEREASRWRLAVPRRRLAGRIGDRAGRGLGASIEFEDHRPYQPGDDPRHVDWRAYARTDRLDVRVYREEVAPAIDFVADTSASMATTPAKLATLHDLIAGARRWAGIEGGTLRVLAAGASGPLDPDRPLPVGGVVPTLVPAVGLRANGLRIVVSDFLVPRPPQPELTRLAVGAAFTFVVQLLDPWELEPSAGGTVTLVDVEDAARVDVALDARTIAAYRSRLDRLSESVADATRRIGGRSARVVAGAADAVFAELARQGVLEPS